MADANNNITYSLADIQRYLQGSMSAREMHDLERTALEDPFLADALEGYSEADMLQAQQHLAQIEATIRNEQKERKVVALTISKRYRNWHVAAAVILFIGMASITYIILNKKTPEVALVQAKSNANSETKMDSSTTSLQRAASPTANAAPVTNVEKKYSTKANQTAAKQKKTDADRLNITPQQVPAPAAAMTAGADKAKTQDSVNATEGHLLAEGVTIAAPGKQINGVITDNHQQPVPNATLTLPDSTQAVTDRNGNFKIATIDSNVVADVQAFGYKPLKNQQLRSGYNKILLKEKPFSLSDDVEVINIGNEGKRTGDTINIMPQGGWQSFQDYMRGKLHKKYDSTHIANIRVNGNLELEFSISEVGEPINFKVLHAPDDQTAAEAINAIKAGPKWINSTKKNKTRIRVNY